MDSECLSLLREMLTEAEINVYCTLLEKGPMTASKISNETSLNRSNLYRIFDRLSKRKLIAVSISDKTRHFSANNPSVLKEILTHKIHSLKEKQKHLDSLISSLQDTKKYEKDTAEFNISVYSGAEELKSLLNSTLELKKGETIYAIGYKGILKKVFYDFWINYKRKRAAKGIIFRGVLSTDSADVKKPKSIHTHLRYADLKQMANMRIDFFRNTIILFIIEKNPRAIVIKNKEMANGMKAYFEFLWKNAIKP